MIKSLNKFYLVFFLSILFVTYTHAQYSTNIDSLTIELNKAHDDSIKVDILSKLFWGYQRANPDTALIFAEQALEISQANNLTYDIAESKRLIGIVRKVQGDYQRALNLFEGSKNYYFQTNDTAGVYTCLTDIGDVYYKQNNFLLATEHYYEAMEYIRLSADKQSLGRIYHKLGGIYKQQKQYNKALE